MVGPGRNGFFIVLWLSKDAPSSTARVPPTPRPSHDKEEALHDRMLAARFSPSLFCPRTLLCRLPRFVSSVAGEIRLSAAASKDKDKSSSPPPPASLQT